MQALTIWPLPMGDFCRVPPVESHLGHSFCVILTKKRRDSILSRRNLRDFGDKSVRFDFVDGYFSGCSRFRVLPGKSSMGVFAHMGCPSVEQDLGAEDLASETLNTTVDCLKIDEIAICDDERKVNGDSGYKEEVVKEEDNLRVDVLALAHSLQSSKSADEVENVMKDKGNLPLQVYSSMIRGFGREKKLEAAIALVEWLKKKGSENEGFEGPNLFIYNSLLGAIKQSRQFELVDKVMSDMLENGMSPNIVTYNTLMTIYVDQGRPLEALSLLEEIQAKGLLPSPISYSTALLAYRRTEDGLGALRFFIELRDRFIKGELLVFEHEDWEGEFMKLQDFTGRICFQVMRQWIVKEGNNTTNVLKLLIELDKAGFPPTRAEYEKLIWACTREEHYTVTKELYTRIRERHSDISLSVCNHVIWLMGRAKKWWAALEIYENLLDKGPEPNNLSYELVVSHFNILLTAARKRGIWRWGVRLLNKMESKGLKPGSKEWNAVLVACSKASETQAAVQIFKRMVEQGEKPTVISYGALLSALEKGKLYEEAIRVWEHMLKVGIKPNLYAYTIMASIYVGLGKFKVVDLIIKEMVRTENNKPTVVTFNAIISGCARNGWGGAAYEWFHRMKAMNIEPNKVTYEMLIEALAKDGKPKLAYELYVRANNECLGLSSKAYDAVVESSVNYGATIDMGLLGPRPVEEKKRVQTRKELSEFCRLADVPRRSEPFNKEELYSKLNL